MNVLDAIMGVQEASELWSLHPDHIKRLCERGIVQARKIGKTWIILRVQPNPSKYKKAAD